MIELVFKQFLKIYFWTPKNIWALGGSLHKILEKTIWLKRYCFWYIFWKNFWKLKNIRVLSWNLNKILKKEIYQILQKKIYETLERKIWVKPYNLLYNVFNKFLNTKRHTRSLDTFFYKNLFKRKHIRSLKLQYGARHVNSWSELLQSWKNITLIKPDIFFYTIWSFFKGQY